VDGTTEQKYERLAGLVKEAEDEIALVAPPEGDAPKHTCAHCGTVLEAPVNVKGAYQPKEGDAAFCFGCGNVSMFDPEAASGTRVPNEPELEALSHNEGLLRMRDFWLSAQPKQQNIH
jgi:hypothetical protein